MSVKEFTTTGKCGLLNITHYHYFFMFIFVKSGYDFILCKLKAIDKNSRLVIQSINVKLLNYKTKGFNNLLLCDMIHQMQQFSLINDIYACITKEVLGFLVMLCEFTINV